MDLTPVNEYIAFLWSQLQYDWSVSTMLCVLYTVIPAILFLVLFFVKWYILLALITIPISVSCMSSEDNRAENVRNELNQRLK